MPKSRPGKAVVDITRQVSLPDLPRVALYRHAPELGPKILFFSGGTALRHLSGRLIEYTANSIHLITPFDSGGSSAVLRQAFAMPAVGDIRNRIMALADRSITGNPAVFALFAHRLPKDAPEAELAERLSRMIAGEDPLVRHIPDPMRKIIRTHLLFFSRHMPAGFNLRGASIGNLILAGGYFNYNRRLDPVIYLFMRLVEARGIVRPVVNADAHLACQLEDGRVIIGQHLMTGKEAPPLTSRVKRLWLTANMSDPAPVTVKLREKNALLLREAGLICYPFGSFFSSLLANLLPQGVGEAVAQNPCPKVYIPNTGLDPEQHGMTVADCAATLLDTLEQTRRAPGPRRDLLRFVLVDSKNGLYPGRLDLPGLKALGLEVIDAPLITEESRPGLDSRLVLEHLLSLA